MVTEFNRDHPHLPKRRRRRSRVKYGFALTLFLVLTTAFLTILVNQFSHIPLPNLSVPALLNQQPGLYPVVRVNDGDTIVVKTPAGNESVRLLGVDTPEVKDPRKPVQCFGEAASAHTKQALNGASVRLEPDPTNTDRDKYGRLLRYVYLPDGTLYNAALIRDGYGFAYTVFPITKLEEFRALEADARANSRGLWAGCHINDTNKVKQTTGHK